MPQCCRCNGGGKCRNCVCAKAKRPCTNCLPSRRGCCSNTAPLPVSLTLVRAHDPTTDPSSSNGSLSAVTSRSPELPPCSSSGGSSLTGTSFPTCNLLSDSPNVSSPINALLSPTLPPLPTPTPLANPSFVWGPLDAESFIHSVTCAYSEVVHWRKNTFTVPYGNAGKRFVTELSTLYRAYAEGSALECIALKAITVMSVLLLQKPHSKSKSKEHSSCLDRRLQSWKEGDLNNLMLEGRTLQNRLPKSSATKNDEAKLARTFTTLMFQGKTNAAMQLLSQRCKGGVLHVNDPIDHNDLDSQSVLDILKSKHPSAQPATPEAVLLNSSETPSQLHPVVFDQIEAKSIRSAALRTKGAAGPSGIDAHCWRRLCTSFKSASNDLCHSLALLARRLCTSHVDPRGLSSLLACRLIALDKCPGVRPIGICETARRIVSKAVLSVAKIDLQEAAGSLQLCAGQIAGIEAAVHAMKEAFVSEENDAVLLVDASNAFNSLNREAALHNIQHLCPTLSTILINCYREATELFVDGIVLYSEEGTTQGDPLAMPMYALATIPLINQLGDPSNIIQVWYADDASVAGGLASIRSWWDKLSSIGPAFGYFPNATKTWLITKDSLLDKANEIFHDTEVRITSQGRPHLGAPLGSQEFVKQFIADKVNQWMDEMSLLVDVAKTQPHAAFAAFIHGYVHKFNYLCRTVPNVDHALQPLEDQIRSQLIPVITGHSPPNDATRDLLSLPARLGGIGLINPTKSSSLQHQASSSISAPLKEQILAQNNEYSMECIDAQVEAKAEAQKRQRNHAKDSATALKASSSHSLQRAMDLAQEKGASSWLTTLPLEEFGFTLHKTAFSDAIALRYGWQPSRCPSSCACGSNFSVEHALSCPKGGFPIVRHNEIRDLTANLLTEVCHDVCVEPTLQPITGETFSNATANSEDGARLDVAASGFWGGRFERAFFDVRVFNPHAPSNRQPLPSCYRKHENLKKRAYEQRVREVEHGSFIPLVFSLTGGMGNAASVCYKCLASLISAKRDTSYSSTLAWIRCSLSFSLLRSSIQCIRGARSAAGRAAKQPIPPVDLVSSEARLSTSC